MLSRDIYERVGCLLLIAFWAMDPNSSPSFKWCQMYAGKGTTVKVDWILGNLWASVPQKESNIAIISAVEIEQLA